MDQNDACRNSGAAARGRFADFLFVGLGIVPVYLMLNGEPAIAILLFIPLLVAACLCGMWEQVAAESDGASGGVERGAERAGTPPAAAGVSLRRKLP